MIARRPPEFFTFTQISPACAPDLSFLPTGRNFIVIERTGRERVEIQKFHNVHAAPMTVARPVPMIARSVNVVVIDASHQE